MSAVAGRKSSLRPLACIRWKLCSPTRVSRSGISCRRFYAETRKTRKRMQRWFCESHPHWRVFLSFPTLSRAVRKQSRTHRLPTSELQRMHRCSKSQQMHSATHHVDTGDADKRALAKNKRHWRRRLSPNCARSKLTLT